MTGMRFVDTNVLLYRISNDPAEASKAAVAAEILAQPDVCLSVQVLQEFYVQATQPSRGGRLTHRDAVDLMATWRRFPVQEMTVSLLDRALDAKERWGISFWDASIIEAARALGCGYLLSEDLSDGQDYGGVRVVNPFA